MISTIYHDFLRVLRDGGDRDALLRGYLLPNQDLLRRYVEHVTVGLVTWEQFVAEFRRYWLDDPDALPALLNRLDGVDVEALARQGYTAAMALLAPETDIDVALIVSAAVSDSFLIAVDGKLVAGIALETFGWQFGAVALDFGDIPHMLAHELCHAVRAAAGASAAQAGNHAPAPLDRLPLGALLVEEGLAEVTAAAVDPSAPPERLLLYPPEDYAWCATHEADLWSALGNDWQAPIGQERYLRFFTKGPANGSLPPRTGYFLGYRLVQRQLAAQPTLGLADAVRLPAAAFLP